MNENRFPDYLDHMQQAAIDACGFVEGLSKADFLEGKRSQQAVIMSLIIGEAATKVMDGYVEFTQAHPQVPWRSMRGMRNRISMDISTSTLMWCGVPFRRCCQNSPSNYLSLTRPTTTSPSHHHRRRLHES